MHTEPDRKNSSFTIPLLLSLLIANPAVLYLLSESLVWSLVILSLVSIVVVLLYQIHYRWYSVYSLNILVILSFFLHFELVFRFGFPEYVIEDLYDLKGSFYFNKPNLFKTLTDKEFSVLYATNAQGYRIDESMDRERTLESCDWLFLGDSYTQGAQVNFMELYTSRLYEQFPHKIIVNAGISGFGIAEELEYYKSHGRKLHPKKVFLQLCSFNDFMNVEMKEYGLTDRLMQYSGLARSILYSFKYKSPGELPLGRWTEPFYPTEKDNITYNVFYTTSDEKKQSDLENAESLLREFAEEVRNDGAELIVFLIPTKEQIYYQDFSEVVESFRIDVGNLDMSFPNKFLHRLTALLGISFIDLKESFGVHPQRVFFTFDEHLNAEGHQLLADILASHLSVYRSDTKLMSTTFYGDRYPSYFGPEKRIVYQSFRDGSNELFVADSMLRNPVRLTINAVDESHPTVSRNGEYLLATIGNAKTVQTTIERMTINGTERTMLTKSPNQFGAIPSFSHRANLIAFAEWFFDEHTNRFSQPIITISDIEGNILRRITNDNTEHWRPVFGQGDSTIIYIAKRDGNFDLFEFNLHRSQEKRLTSTPYDEWDPNVSPDGRRIVYAGKEKGNWDLFEFDLSTLQAIQLTSTSGDEWDPFYSPDGKHILYAGEYGLFRGIYKLERKARN